MSAFNLMDNNWTIVSRKKRMSNTSFDNCTSDRFNDTKINQPCWFFNNGGCRNKDGSTKDANDCKYLHVYSDDVNRPPHLNTKKPCDKYNLEGECPWFEGCKYSHRNLSPDEWSLHYPGIPYTLRTNIQKRLLQENKIQDMEGRLKVLEFKQNGITRDFQTLIKKSGMMNYFYN